MDIKLIDPFTNREIFSREDGLYFGSEQIFPKKKGVYRILKSEINYTESFGFQWNKFKKTQIDTVENNLSKVRFFAETNWKEKDLNNLNILEVGSGAGRFSEVVLKYTKANLYSVDYSNAVEVNYENNGHFGERLKLFQASLYDLPFAPNQFDKVFCFGVLQHTPDFKKSVQCLVEQVKPGGELVVDFYPIKGWWTKICCKYMLRPFTKKLSHEKLLDLIDSNIDWLISAYKFLFKVRLGFLSRFLPICDIYGTLPYKSLTNKELREWCVLDTFDMFSPEHDYPQKISTVKNWFEEFGMQVTWADYVKYGNAEAATVRGIKPS